MCIQFWKRKKIYGLFIHGLIGEHLLRVLRRVGLLHVLKKAVVNSGAVELLFPSNALKFSIGVSNVKMFFIVTFIKLY